MSDPPPMSDAEKMRLKRLARLGGTSTPVQTPPSDQSPTSATGTPTPEPRQPAASSSRLLSTPLPAASTPIPIKEQARRPSNSATNTPSPSSLGKRPLTSSIKEQDKEVGPKVVATPQRVKATVSYPEWENKSVGAVFSVALDRKVAQDSDWRLCWLKDLEEEILSEDSTQKAPLATKLDLADRLLIARLSLDPSSMGASDDPDVLMILAGLPQSETAFEYLTGCWKRLHTVNRDLARLQFTSEEKAHWAAASEKLRALIISYCGMTLEDPTMFPQPSDKPVGPAEFLPLLLSIGGASSTNASDPLTSTATAPVVTVRALSDSDILPFLQDLGAGFTSDTLADVVSPTLSLFFQEWFKITPTPDIMGSDWRNYLGAVSTLTQVKAIAAILPTLQIWVAPGVTAPKLEWQSLLGPLTRLSVYPREFGEIWKAYFSNPTERQVADIDANKSNLRHTLQGLQSSLFDIYNSIIRASPDSREAILNFFTLVISLNEKRSGSRVDPRTISSDGFMTNLQMVLLKLFEPVMDVKFSKIDKVDPEYYRYSKRIKIDEETKMRGTKEEADEYYGSQMDVDKPANFISDLFFLLNSFVHLGGAKTISTRNQAEEQIGRIEKELKNAERDRPNWAGNPPTEAQGEAAIKRYKQEIATLHASVHAYDTQIRDKVYMRANISFLGFVMNWLIRLVDKRHQHPQRTISLPLPKEAPLQFRMLPEFFIDNIVEYYQFFSKHESDVLDDVDKDILLSFVMTFLTPNYVNNPFLKAKLVNIIANGLQPQGYWRKGPLFDRLSVHSLSTDYLMPTMIQFWIDVEATGGHQQFYDKFNFRRDISHIFKSMWSNALHREAFAKFAKTDLDTFVKFVNMLMSDTTFLLEEALTNLHKISTVEALKANVDGWNALPQNERDDHESQLRSAEQATPFYAQMGMHNVELLRDLTATTKEPFVVPEIVDRLAATLDENIVTLAGPRMQELKVSNPERLYFKPKQLLAGITQIYLNLSEEKDFVRAVANDGRAYSKETFERFARVLKNRAIMTEGEVAEIVAFTQRVEDAKATIQIEDERDIPDEFLDPLLATLMRDPVILPVSKVTIDRSTIRTHLLSTDKDPFNNVPMKLEEVIPNTELKAQIDAWVAEGQTTRTTVMDVDQL